MVAKEWGVTPHVADRELLDDPERLSLACIPLLRYADAHAAFKRHDPRETKALKGHRMFQMVEAFEFEKVRRQLDGGE